MQLHMGSGKRGRYDERVLIYPHAPIFSSGGRRFLQALTRATRRRLQFTLRLREGREDYVEAMRFRAPDACRMLWAMGKLRWRSAPLLRLLETAAVQDIACEWNRPRYVTTALWGSAWSAPGVPLLRLCDTVQNLPEEFWTGAAPPLMDSVCPTAAATCAAVLDHARMVHAVASPAAAVGGSGISAPQCRVP